MPREFSRQDRMSDAILKEMAQLIRDSVRDPRVGMVNVNAVKLSKDLSHARIYVTFVDNPKNETPARRVEVLNKASGFLRAELANSMRSRTVPHLNFQHDEVIYEADRMSRLIDGAIKQDQEKHQD